MHCEPPSLLWYYNEIIPLYLSPGDFRFVWWNKSRASVRRSGSAASRAHLVHIAGDRDDQVEGGVGGNRRGLALLETPGAELHRVDHHVRRLSVVTGIKVERNVGVAPGAALQVHMEPGAKQSIKTSITRFDMRKHSAFSMPYNLKWLNVKRHL